MGLIYSLNRGWGQAEDTCGRKADLGAGRKGTLEKQMIFEREVALRRIHR